MGGALVFVSDRSGTSDLWSVGIADGKPSAAPERLKSNIGDISNLGFARDGTFFYGTRTLGRDIVTASLDSAARRVGAPVSLTQTLVRSNSGAAWSPDGRRIAFFRGGDTIVVRTTATGEERVVPTKLHGAVVLQGIRWFPDGRAADPFRRTGRHCISTVRPVSRRAILVLLPPRRGRGRRTPGDHACAA